MGMKPASLFLLPLIAHSLASGQPVNARQASTIQWSRCPQNVSSAVSCGTVTVPLDYTSPNSSATIELKLVKRNATQQPSKGSILYNPGGPGLSGRETIPGFEGEALQLITGGQFDIVSWDPRGTGDTLPFSCFKSEAARTYLTTKTPTIIDPSDPELQTVWTAKSMLSRACSTNARDIGELIGTAFSARDMMQIVDALGEDGLLRYWGISYGTVLGATAAAMFPERIDRMVLDSVVNLHQYYAGDDTQQLGTTEAALDGFVTACIASPDLCPLAALDTSTKSLRHQVDDLFEVLRYKPALIGSDPYLGYIDLSILRPFAFQALYNPVALWPPLATLMHAILTDNATAYYAAVAESLPSAQTLFPNKAGIENVQGIRCSDVAFRTNNLTDARPWIDDMYAQSPHFGMHLAALQVMTCAQWPFAAKERYEGDFKVSTRHPVLFMGNVFDPATSLDGAWNASATFEGSTVLVQDGYGHSTLAQPSVCSAKAIRTYFEDGTLPADDTICKVDVPLFTNETLLGSLRSNLTKRDPVIEQRDDEQLLMALKQLNRGLTERGVFM